MDTEIWDIYNEINNSYLNNEINEDNNDPKETENKLKQSCINCKKEDFLLIDCEMVVCT